MRSIISRLTQWGATLVIQLSERERDLFHHGYAGTLKLQRSAAQRRGSSTRCAGGRQTAAEGVHRLLDRHLPCVLECLSQGT